MNDRFEAAEARWLARLGGLRNIVRQELVARQLEAHLPAVPCRVLDVGCGQGTQAVRLARHGHQVTGLDSSRALLARLDEAIAAESAGVRERVRVVHGEAERLAELFPTRSFDVVLCQGVLMYVADPEPILRAIARVTSADGVVSLLVRNGDGLAMRPGLRGDWATTAEAFDETSYVNRMGVNARADRLDDLRAMLVRQGLVIRDWYGVRVFTDLAADNASVPDGNQLAAMLECEERAGRTDPYRGVAALTHVIAVPGGESGRSAGLDEVRQFEHGQ